MQGQGCIESEYPDLDEFFDFLNSTDLDGFGGLSGPPLDAGGQDYARGGAGPAPPQFLQHDGKEMQKMGPFECAEQGAVQDGSSNSIFSNSLIYQEASTGAPHAAECLNLAAVNLQPAHPLLVCCARAPRSKWHGRCWYEHVRSSLQQKYVGLTD